MENREKIRETKPDNRSLKRASVFFPSLFDLIKSEKIEKERERLLCIMRRTNVSAYSLMNSQSE